ncbi:helix-turn-helix domain-containing protein [Microbacterium sp. cx-55]|uniref:arsenate reductase/protein-tyrosine-phosphatase family protein n=1 Tax=Microbacterium sp. cx-55 TaxID=2875948 RepID=UPI001CBC2111|nr:helix-turn-helix domain-containing protein [Microbacterium sp. cx-55]MBZ4487888.1 helix-turn-helix domain-containing protein [Microbacterium sp. cx-55]UGB34701.1 helix-turn-helix domain-containing protein [Microbacterium sp. cx-55]
MTAEQTDSVVERAATHAALGDASRLRVVDLLTLGDLSPTEIGTTLELPSNLIAHHLNVLESAGVITRGQSEADGRRSYVRLAEGALRDLVPGRVARASRVVFICTANSARSQLAAALWATHSSIPAVSGGTHPAEHIDPGALAAARRHDLALPPGAPRSLSAVISDADFVVTVCDRAHEELRTRDEGEAGGRLHWSIPDPVRVGSEDAFDSAFAELERRITHLASALSPR